MTSDRIGALAQAVERSPDSAELRLLFAETLCQAGEMARAVEQFAHLLDKGALQPESVIMAGEAAVATGDVELAARFRDEARRIGAVDGLLALEQGVERLLASEGVVRLVKRSPQDASAEPHHRVTFADVGGLEDVKKTIHRTIILPFERPDLYRTYGRKMGGGVLLFGPPGCGKTLLARATAGECGLPFHNIRIEDILDPWLGMSERNLHDRFEAARAAAPCVLFIDELDAVAYARHNQRGNSARALVNQLLQEMDAIGVDNDQLMILAATNAPWDVDDGLKRPGRFDRVVFVPPPDVVARTRILELRLAGRPTRAIDLGRLANETPLYSGADLVALVERALDFAIDDALAAGSEVPITMDHLERAREDQRATTLDWLSTARSYVEFANQGGLYDEVGAFLKSREVKARLK